ncbi:PP2C family protein-serine/threonine phosphatase [Streptomyces sp. NPDC049097]|uniref:PP2C family protein-serine/threonine phosphatase n=1 Tax=Streptomyces sp. NPDC049097 TaxID=3155497 RepID=UPI00343ABB04
MRYIPGTNGSIDLSGAVSPQGDGRPRLVQPSATVSILLIVLTSLGAFFAPVAIAGHWSPLLVAAPIIAAAFVGSRFTAGVVVVAGGATVVIDHHDGLLRSPILPLHFGALLAISAVALTARTLHDRSVRDLHQIRTVSEAVQTVLLRPIPRHMGCLRAAAVYRAAAEHARVGGDLYAAARTGRATRLLIGDVRGKGLPAIHDASALVSAFHDADHLHDTLAELAASLERSVRRHLTQLTECDSEFSECFITALLAEIPDDGGRVDIVNCGHPPPLLRRHGHVNVLESHRPAPPFGLAGDEADAFHPDTFAFGAGDTLLFYTDGIIEARDTAGDFYPLAQRASGWPWGEPEAILQRISDDLDAYTGRRLDDDLAMMAVQYCVRPCGEFSRPR